MNDKAQQLINEMIEEGKARYWSQYQAALESGRFADTQACTRLQTATTQLIGLAIADWMSTQGSRRAGNQTTAYQKLKGMQPRTVGAIGLHVVLSLLPHNSTLQEIAAEIGQQLLHELNLDEYKTIAPDDFNKAKHYVAKSGMSHKVKTLMVLARKNVGPLLTRWTLAEKAAVGMSVYTIIADITGFFTTFNRATTKKVGYISCVAASEGLIKWFEAFHANGEVAKPNIMPLLSEPEPWVTYFGGGTPETLPSVHLISKRDIDYERELLSQASIDPVLASLNHIQNTAWKINKPVLDKIKQLVAHNIEISKLIKLSPDELPEKPKDIDSNDEARKEYKREAHKIHKHNSISLSKRFQVQRLINLSEKFSTEERFYFPYNLDFRGRVYPKVPFLTPQGSELTKALLLFADGKPIESADEAKWLAIHGANCWGEDKVSYAERVEFIEVMTPEIEAIASGESNEWMEADDPLLFYAFCLEWAAFKKSGFGFITHLPVSVDGANNGSQILGLMTRDADICTATNVLPTETPHDIYKEVADQVQLLIDKEDKEDPMIKIINTYITIDRTLVKKQVMTKPYSATMTSCKEYTHARVEEQLKGAPITLNAIEVRELSTLLAKHIMTAMDIRMAGPVKCMSWLQSCAKLILQKSDTIDWFTPMGLPVRQYYRDTKSTVVSTNVLGAKRIRIRELTEKPNKFKSINGVSPNFVHSLDAAALQQTVLSCKNLGINNLMCIHDSFGTLATDVEALQAAIRHSYYTIFKEDVLLNLKKFWETRYSIELPELPAYGTMSVEDLLDSDYFFA